MSLHYSKRAQNIWFNVVTLSLILFQTRFSIVIDYVRKYATEEALRGQENVSSDSESTMSDFSENEAEDMEL